MLSVRSSVVSYSPVRNRKTDGPVVIHISPSLATLCAFHELSTTVPCGREGEGSKEEKGHVIKDMNLGMGLLCCLGNRERHKVMLSLSAFREWLGLVRLCATQARVMKEQRVLHVNQFLVAPARLLSKSVRR